MRPSKIAAPVWQASGLSGSALPGTRSIEAVIGSYTPRRCASVTGMRSASTGGCGSMPNSFTLPLANVMWMVSDFFDVVVDAALRGAGAGALRKRLHQSGCAAEGRSLELIVADLDGPRALADRDAGERR